MDRCYRDLPIIEGWLLGWMLWDTYLFQDFESPSTIGIHLWFDGQSGWFLEWVMLWVSTTGRMESLRLLQRFFDRGLLPSSLVPKIDNAQSFFCWVDAHFTFHFSRSISGLHCPSDGQIWGEFACCELVNNSILHHFTCPKMSMSSILSLFAFEPYVKYIDQTYWHSLASWCNRNKTICKRHKIM